MILGQGTRVALSPDEAPIVHRSPSALVKSGAVQWVHNTPNLVMQEPGWSPWPGIDHMKFLPDGRLVDENALGGAMGAVPIFTTWTAAKSRWASVITDTNNLNTQVTAWYQGGKLSAPQTAFVNGWVAFRDNVYNDYKSLARWTTTELASTAYERADARLSELGQWRQRFQTLSGVSALPGSSPNTKTSDVTTIVKYVAVAAGVVAVAGVVGKLLLAKRAAQAVTS